MQDSPLSSQSPRDLFHIPERDILSELIENQRSASTRRAYEAHLRRFFKFSSGRDLSPELVAGFLQLGKFDAIALVLKYRSHLASQGLSEASINQFLAAVKALARFAEQIGRCGWNLQEIKREKERRYRDTSGVSKEQFGTMLAAPNRVTVKGKRDYALLRLFWDNVLRRGEIHKADIKDFVPAERTLRIFGKGRGRQPEFVSLSESTIEAVQVWLRSRGNPPPEAPLFIALDRANYGHRLSGRGLAKIVEKIAKAAGIEKQMSPHRIRHSGITAALDATNGNVRKVQKLSRHVDLNTVVIYDDNRRNLQAEVTELLAGLVD